MNNYTTSVSIPSVLWCCWLGVKKGIRPVKIWVVGCWRGYLSGARCRLAYGPADATATHMSLAKIQTGFTILVLAQLGSPGQKAIKWVCVCVHNFSINTLFYLASVWLHSLKIRPHHQKPNCGISRAQINKLQACLSFNKQHNSRDQFMNGVILKLK